MTLNFKAVVDKNPAIGAEFAKTGKMVSFEETEIPHYMFAKKSPEASAREKRVQKYEARSNSCPTCNLALPATKVCDDCG